MHIPIRFPILACLLSAALLSACDEEEWRTVELDVFSLAAADSVGAGQPLPVQFGYYSTSEDQFSSYRWESVDVSTLRLRVFYRFRVDGERIGAPASPTSSTVELENPPAGAFRILAGDLILPVQGGVEPTATARLTVLLRQEGAPLPGVGLRIDTVGPDGMSESFELAPTDEEGATRSLGGCSSPGARFAVGTENPGFLVFGTSRWPTPCERPLTLVLEGRALAEPTSSAGDTPHP